MRKKKKKKSSSLVLNIENTVEHTASVLANF